MFGFIYITTNKINGRKYIGKCAYNRLNGWEDYLGSGKLLKQAIEKYGRENFEREIVCECETSAELDALERNYIAEYNACADPLYYNLAEGGTGGNTRLGYTDEEYEAYRAKFSAPRELNGMWGRKHTEQSNNKNRESIKKKWASDEAFREKHRQATIEGMKKVPKESLSFDKRSRNIEMTCTLCGNIEQVYTSQQLYCSDCKSKHSKWELSVLKSKKDI